MGLDMYLNAERYFFNEETAPVVEGHTVKTAVVEAGYWRKANAIHDWFVKNCQEGEDDCRTVYVSRDTLEQLRDTCLKVLADPSQAPELLPTCSGFFFGGTEYDEWYLETLTSTVIIINEALEKFNPRQWDFYYTSSW